MFLYWYTCISMNTNLHIIYHILLENFWWVLSNASLTMWICLTVYEILVNEAFTVINSLISQLFVVTFVHSIYIQIAIIYGFPTQLSLWKLVYWLWRYKLYEVCDTLRITKEYILDENKTIELRTPENILTVLVLVLAGII